MADASTVMCIECGDQDAAVNCIGCNEPFCQPCWQQQHRRGKRMLHRTQPILGELMPQPAGVSINSNPAETALPDMQDATPKGSNGEIDSGAPMHLDGEEDGTTPAGAFDTMSAYANVPLRLSDGERGLLGVLQGALHVSEYTDKVDTIRWNKEQRILEELQEILDQISGLLTCHNYKLGQSIALCSYADNAVFFRNLFEIARRYKIMNPEKMRSTYGKMMYCLQDAIDSKIQSKIGFSVLKPIMTVQSLLQDSGASGMLRDPLLYESTRALDHVLASELQQAAARKEKARKELCSQYASETFLEAEVMRVVHSVSDAQAYEATATYPVKRMLHYLTTYFDRNEPGAKHGNLALRFGEGGSKLSHSHATQYSFVYQSLRLWERIMQHMFSLWKCADGDLLNERAYYHLSNTGQGLQRVQACPKVSSAMNSILSSVHAEVDRWVGLSVVHLGDRDVPNSLIFIDKYTQVPRILGPIVQTIEQLEAMAADPGARHYIDKTFGGIDMLRMEILNDYFRHGFDGSGDDGGSCVDGRLTSTWNWCSRIEKKRFFHIFMLAGFTGFDGDWRVE